MTYIYLYISRTSRTIFCPFHPCVIIFIRRRIIIILVRIIFTYTIVKGQDGKSGIKVNDILQCILQQTIAFFSPHIFLEPKISFHVHVGIVAGGKSSVLVSCQSSLFLPLSFKLKVIYVQKSTFFVLKQETKITQNNHKRQHWRSKKGHYPSSKPSSLN